MQEMQISKKRMKQLRIQFSEIGVLGRLCNPGGIAVQRQSTMYSELLHEGEPIEGKAQWWISRALWP